MNANRKIMAIALGGVTIMSLAACGTSSGAPGADAAAACDDGYPADKVDLILPYPPGGSTDLTARRLGPLLAEKIGADVVVINREGGSGTIGVAEVVQAKPDGATIGLGVTTSFAISPVLNKEVPYDGIDDVQTVGEVNAPVLTLAVKADSPMNDLTDLIEYAKGHPGELNIATPGENTSTELVYRAFAVDADIDANLVPYTGGGPANTAVLKGEADVTVASAGAIKGLVDGGELKNIGVVSRLDDSYLGVGKIAELQTTEEAGYEPGLVYSQFLFTPKGVPSCAVDILVEATKTIVTSDEWATFSEENYMPVSPKNPEELAADVKEQRADYEALMKELGLLK